MFNILILGIVSLLTDVSSEMVYPLLPLFLISKLGATPAIVGIIEGIAESLASILKVFSGAISDKLGKRKPLTIGGYSSAAIGKILLVYAASWHTVLLGRVVDRFGKGVRTAPRDALIAESAEEGKRGAAFGLHRFMDTLGAAIGIVLAYFLLTGYKGDYHKVFLVSTVPALLGVAFLFLVKEKGRQQKAEKTTGPSEPRGLLSRWKDLNPRLRAFLIVTFVFTLGNSSNQFLLLRAKDVGFSSSSVILLYLVYNLVSAGFSYPAGRVSDRLGRRTLLVLGYLMYGLVYMGFAFVSRQSTVWFLFAAYGLYTAFTEGVEKALVADIAPKDQKATLMGLHATLVGIGLLPASTIAGFLWNSLGPKAPFMFGGFMGIAAAAGLGFVLREESSRSPEPGASVLN